jgi:5-methyltetrahydrofolate corrinoid/iron sulfur protein methyltransferase
MFLVKPTLATSRLAVMTVRNSLDEGQAVARLASLSKLNSCLDILSRAIICLMKKTLITIGESVHASIPRTGQAMKQLTELGPSAYLSDDSQDSVPSEPLNYIKNLIESQATDGADYIAVNLDVFGEDNPQIAVDMMRQYVKLVHKYSNGVPICIDSSDNNVLIAGLKEWYNTSEDRGQKTEDSLRSSVPSASLRTSIRHPSSVIRSPLINSVKVYTMDKILPLKKDYDFAFIGLLIGEDKPTGPGGSHSVDELYSLAQQLFDSAVGKYGFKPGEIFFDSTVFPLAIDMPMEPSVPGYTYRTFETIKKIKSDRAMKGVHCSLGISNSVRDLPGRKIGVCRAYVAKAMEYGLDAAIANVSHHYGEVEPAPELLELIDAYAKMDGSAERMNKAMELMGKFCRDSRKTDK